MGQDIHGLIVDSGNKAVAYANVVLMAKADSTYISGAVSSEDGNFTIENTSNKSLSECLVSVSYIGYKTEYLQAAKDMGTIVLDDKAEQLSEVVVSGRRSPTIKLNNGVMQVNIQHTVLSNTGNCIEVLSLLPFMSHTSDGVSVFGRGTPLIYIDNRKVQNNEELQKLSSDEIKNVAVDLHPGAEYGNDVKAVVKITTIRKGEGLSASVTATGSQYRRFNASGYVNLNYRMNKWDIFGSLYANRSNSRSDVENDIDFTDGNTPISVVQNYASISKGYTINPDFGINYSNDGKNYFGVKYDFYRKPSSKSDVLGSNRYMENNVNVETDDMDLRETYRKSKHGLNAYYITNFGKGSRFNVNLDYIKGLSESDDKSYLGQNENVDTYSKDDYNLYVGKAVMTHDVWGGSLQYGTELSYTDYNSSYHYNKNVGTSLTESDDENKQTLWSAFASFEREVGIFSFDGGLRLDVSAYDYYHQGERQDDLSKSYSKLLPYLQVDFKIKGVSTSISYNSTVRRPSYGLLNGSTVYADKYTYTRGNPYLKSAYEHTLDLTMSWKDFSIDAYYTWYQGSIYQIANVMEGEKAILFTTENIANYGEFGAIFNYSPTIGLWHPKLDLDIFKQDLTYAGHRYYRPTYAYGLDNIFSITDDVNISFKFWGQTAGDLYLMEFKPNFRADISLNAYLFKKRLSVWLAVSDIFKTDKERNTRIHNGVTFKKDRVLDNRGVKLQLRYSFNSQSRKYRGRTSNSEIMRL